MVLPRTWLLKTIGKLDAAVMLRAQSFFATTLISLHECRQQLENGADLGEHVNQKMFTSFTNLPKTTSMTAAVEAVHKFEENDVGSDNPFEQLDKAMQDELLYTQRNLLAEISIDKKAKQNQTIQEHEDELRSVAPDDAREVRFKHSL